MNHILTHWKAYYFEYSYLLYKFLTIEFANNGSYCFASCIKDT